MKETVERVPGRSYRWILLATVLALASVCRSPALASEALGDLELQLRVLDVTPSTAGQTSEAAGVARIEAVVQAAVPTRDVRLRILHPDGTPWMVGSRPYDPGQPAWSRHDGGAPLEPGDGSPSVGVSQAIRTVLEIPLRGAAVHEIVVEALGESASGALRTENMVRVALGVPMPLPVDDGTTASFNLEVRP